MGTARQLLIVLIVTVFSTVTVGAAWMAIGGSSLPIHGWTALSLGIAGTVALTWALMRLAFRSDRDGWDARADDTSDLTPRRNSPEA